MSDETLRDGRRRFLKTAALAGGAMTAAAAAAGVTAESIRSEDGNEAAQSPEAKQGYRVTPHIETYYRLARQ